MNETCRQCDSPKHVGPCKVSYASDHALFCCITNVDGLGWKRWCSLYSGHDGQCKYDRGVPEFVGNDDSPPTHQEVLMSNALLEVETEARVYNDEYSKEVEAIIVEMGLFSIEIEAEMATRAFNKVREEYRVAREHLEKQKQIALKKVKYRTRY